MTAILSARDLSVDATLAGETVPVIRRLSFDVAPGSVLGLVGESGAGKSMVGRAIAQLLPPGFAVAAAQLEFAGGDLLRMPAERRRALLGRDIAFVPQEPLAALNPVFTVGQQVDDHLARLGASSSAQRRGEALRLLDRAHLPHPGDVLERYPHQLSGGMCQRVLIALAFASRPRLVIADEPTTALIFITHDLRLAAQICDDILVLYAGRVIERGPARRLLSQPAHPYTRCLQLAGPTMAGPRRAVQAL